MRLPDFLIIGAMKAGTTSLYRDLLTNDQVFMPARKEPMCLSDDHVLTEDGRKEYAFFFQPARDGQMCGEASTGYTKLPDFAGVPERALKVLGSDVRLIYVVREPVSRALSHHYHSLSFGKMPADVETAIREHPMFVDWGRYAMQARPWLDVFGPERLRIVRFETYVQNRRETIEDLSRFLGIDPKPELVQIDEVYNKGDNKPLPKGPMAVIQQRGFYKKYVRPMIPVGTRQKLREMLFPKNEKRPDPPGPDTIEYLIEQLSDDMLELGEMMGLDSPVWDMDAVREKFCATQVN